MIFICFCLLGLFFGLIILCFIVSQIWEQVDDLEIEKNAFIARFERAEEELKKEKKFYSSLSYEVFQSRFCLSDDVREKGEEE